ncbi:MAG: lytic murein transglycosylase [Mesorhizobium sp.]|nr:MAG: lytic murein transglycosylase [Mesorhizobium sp.]TIP02824.1 MAG: lytic murein transglycosylase [Mesorhizobium sp.]TJV73809.1 MAG: lytic murein transglycosylase [Mesorhizobium sp.]
MGNVSLRRPPLCPAGHLPLKGGDWMSRRLSPIANVAGWASLAELLISPLEGEMSGRTEGGAVPPAYLISGRV